MGFFAETIITITTDDRPIAVFPRGSLTLRPETAVVIGSAPDGLPIVLHVQRTATVAWAVFNALGARRREDMPAPLVAALDQLEDLVQQRSRSAGIEEHEGRQALRTRATVGSLFGETLLARLLGSQSPLILQEDSYTPSGRAESVPITSAVALAVEPREVLAKIGVAQHLLVPLDDAAPRVAPPSGPSRPLHLESLAGLTSARFHARLTGDRVTEGPIPSRAYEVAVREALSVSWSVSRSDVARAIVGLAESLGALHASGRVHSDVKPDNALLLASGPRMFDAVDVAAGSISPAASPGWAAPEQILARPVSPATDVFALGLLLARLVGAAIYGEERTFVVPTGHSERRRFRILHDPDVFIDPRTLELDDASREAWRSLIRQAVAFEPDARPRDGRAFARAVSAVLARHELPGRLGLRGGPGRLCRNVEHERQVQPSWVLYERG